MFFRHDEYQFEIPDEWLHDSGITGWNRKRRAYLASQEALEVAVQDVEPVAVRIENGLFRDDIDKDVPRIDRVMRILQGFVADDLIPPVEISRLPDGCGYTYKLTDGTHRFYLSIGAGFTHVPAVERPDWRGIEADRTGQVYPDSVSPDVELPEKRSSPSRMRMIRWFRPQRRGLRVGGGLTPGFLAAVSRLASGRGARRACAAPTALAISCYAHPALTRWAKLCRPLRGWCAAGATCCSYFCIRRDGVCVARAPNTGRKARGATPLAEDVVPRLRRSDYF